MKKQMRLRSMALALVLGVAGGCRFEQRRPPLGLVRRALRRPAAAPPGRAARAAHGREHEAPGAPHQLVHHPGDVVDGHVLESGGAHDAIDGRRLALVQRRPQSHPLGGADPEAARIRGFSRRRAAVRDLVNCSGAKIGRAHV